MWTRTVAPVRCSHAKAKRVRLPSPRATPTVAEAAEEAGLPQELYCAEMASVWAPRGLCVPPWEDKTLLRDEDKSTKKKRSKKARKATPPETAMEEPPKAPWGR